MAEQEVRSPVCRPGSKVGSGQPMSPGARSNPSRGRTDLFPRTRHMEHPATARSREN